jgi:hypothetical protein
LRVFTKKKRKAASRCVTVLGGQFSLAEKLCLTLADVLRAQLVRPTLEVPCEILDGADVRGCCTLSVIATLEFLQHHFSVNGSQDLL